MEDAALQPPSTNIPTTANTSAPAPDSSDEDAMELAIAMSIEPSVRERSVSGDAAPEISRLIGMSTLVNMHVLLSTTSGAIDRVLGNDSSDDDSKTD